MGTVRNARVNQGGPRCAGIVGLGLIGGSFARGYAQAGVRVLAWDPDEDVMVAASMGTVSGELNDETLGECDIIVLACYPEACIEWLEAHARSARRCHRYRGHNGPRGDRYRRHQRHCVRACL